MAETAKTGLGFWPAVAPLGYEIRAVHVPL